MSNCKLFKDTFGLPRIVYCGNGLNLPPPGKFVHLFYRKKVDGLQKNCMVVGYRLGSSDPESSESFWYVGEQRIKMPVVAWIFVPENYELSSEMLFKLEKLGELPL